MERVASSYIVSGEQALGMRFRAGEPAVDQRRAPKEASCKLGAALKSKC